MLVVKVTLMLVAAVSLSAKPTIFRPQDHAWLVKRDIDNEVVTSPPPTTSEPQEENKETVTEVTTFSLQLKVRETTENLSNEMNRRPRKTRRPRFIRCASNPTFDCDTPLPKSLLGWSIRLPSLKKRLSTFSFRRMLSFLPSSCNLKSFRLVADILRKVNLQGNQRNILHGSSQGEGASSERIRCCCQSRAIRRAGVHQVEF